MEGIWIPILAVLGAIIWLAGIICAIHALMNSRTERGSIAWVVSLLAEPIVAIPFYLVFGRRRFFGYRNALDKALTEHRHLLVKARKEFAPFSVPTEQLDSDLLISLSKISRWGFSRDNKFELLVDGEETFESIFEGIEKAEDYVLVQFFIVHADGLGNRLKEAMISKAKEGVRVYFLYDEIGCYSLPKAYISELREYGVEAESFGTTRRSNRFQINFRNHRKIVVVDGKVAFVGGHNVGDEYLGKYKKFGHWRDTHVRIVGPAVLECQMVFLMDWYWATTEIPEVRTTPEPAAKGGYPSLIMPTGPTQDFEVCHYLYHALITNAKERIWISSPYLVPDQATLTALIFAAKRGVDVRIMIPQVKDHLLVYLAAFSYYETLHEAGVKVLRYGPGFLHQKAVLIDTQIAGIGTVNLDQRAFFLNFEVMAFHTDPEFILSVSQMLKSDMENCIPGTGDDYHGKKLPFRLAVSFARLFSPIL